MRATLLFPTLALAVAAGTLLARPPAAPAPAVTLAPATPDTGARRLPTGRVLDPAGRQVDVLPMPLAMLPSPEGDALVLLGSGWTTQGVQVLDRASGRVRQTLEQASAFVGLAWAPRADADGSRALYASGGNGDVVYRYRWSGGRLARADSLVLAVKRTARADGTRYPAGLGISPDGRFLYAAENLGDALAVVDVASGRVVQRLATERYPYGVAVAPNGRVFVSAWGGRTVGAFDPAAPGAPNARPGALARVRDVGGIRHPGALLLDRAGARLFVASPSTDRVVVLDARTLAPLATLADPAPGRAGGAAVREGSTPASLALSADESRLYVAESDNNAVAVFALGAAGAAAPAGRAPAGWYPTAVAVLGESLYVADGKGRGTAANPDGPQPRLSLDKQGSRGATTTLSQITGTTTALPLAVLADPGRLAALDARAARANGWGAAPAPADGLPPFEHVVYVIKENRTYDQILGDLVQADGDSALTFFPRANTPNHHALAERFGIYDRFFVNAEVSGDGHNWSMGAYATDYVQKTVPSNYSGRGRSYDFEGTNRGFGAKYIPADDVAEPASGYLWDLARAAGASFRNYGEFVAPEGRLTEEEGMPVAGRAAPAVRYRGTKAWLALHTDTLSPGFDLTIPDQRRADRWIGELEAFSRTGAMPALEVVRLSNDHTAGAARGRHTPRAYLADNDLALGRMVGALSRSPFWRSTLMVVLEDDAQNGPDHVDSHRAPFLAISAWSRPGVVRTRVNTTDVLATIERALKLGALSQFDYYGRPLSGVWAGTPDLRPYAPLTPAVPLTEMNTAANTTPADARASRRLVLDVEDRADEDTFNRILWRTVKGLAMPYPAALARARRASGHALALEAAGAR